MVEALTRFVHLAAAAFWVGSQLFMFLVAVPALAPVEDPPLRRRVVERLSYRYVTLGWFAIGLLVLTGIVNIFDRGADFALDFDLRYAWILAVKLGLVAAAILITIIHSYVLGPRLLELQALEAEDPGWAARVARLRRLSIVISVLNLLVALAILYLAALLTRPFAFLPA